MLKDIIFLKIF